jgi:geranylgeranyl diphosphate synthase type II
MLNYQESLLLIEEKISEFSYSSKSSKLYDPIKYILSLGGKRLRPCLAIISHNLFCDDLDNIIHPALGLEIFHNFTLLHDDIMDKAQLRRNNPTVHVKWNENAAILSGDAMMIMAYNLIIKTDKELFYQVFNIFNKTALEVCEGQQLDMNFENQDDVNVEQYIEMIRLKTAVLVAASMAIGAVTGRAMETDIDLMYKFGLNIGMAFQLQDDYLDVFADPDKFGKSIGGDILSNKKTYLLISALHSNNNKYLDELKVWLKKEKYNPSDKISAITRIYNLLDIGVHAKQLAESYFLKGFEYFDQIKVEKKKKKILNDIILKTMKREK